jgi:hypothetical protein
MATCPSNVPQDSFQELTDAISFAVIRILPSPPPFSHPHSVALLGESHTSDLKRLVNRAVHDVHDVAPISPVRSASSALLPSPRGCTPSSPLHFSFVRSSLLLNSFPATHTKNVPASCHTSKIAGRQVLYWPRIRQDGVGVYYGYLLLSPAPRCLFASSPTPARLTP